LRECVIQLEFEWRNWIEGRAALLCALRKVDCLRRDGRVWEGKRIGEKRKAIFPTSTQK
jgi:hypothetical protein